jgi:CrcB protein
MYLIWLVAVGGAVGSVLRYLLASAIQRVNGSVFPLGTVVVNIVGCFLIGLLYIWIIEREGPRGWAAPQELRALLMIGVMGGFTTFSSFSLETLLLAMQGNYGNAALNVIVSVVACLLGTGLAIVLARQI